MFTAIPPLLWQFVITCIFAFIVGLEFHNYLRINQYQNKFGSTRTLVFIAQLGFILYQLNTDGYFLQLGFLILSIFLAIYYWRQTQVSNYSLFEVLIALLVFLIGPVAITFPAWFLVLFIVITILMLVEKPIIHQFSENLDNNEVVTLAKFLIISGVILPLLPDTQLLPDLPVTYYKVWIVVLLVSGFSYLNYLAQTYFFKTKGLILTGLLGGLYSSTAISVVISRRAQQMVADRVIVSASLIIATAMMYIRLLVMMFFIDFSVGLRLILPFTGLIVLSLLLVVFLFRRHEKMLLPHPPHEPQNPLELSTAIVFALMFVLFAFITQFVVSHYGDVGLHFLSIIAGFTDIDPFILSLLSGKFTASETAIVSSILIATGSNNVLKAIYIALLARNRSVLIAVVWLFVLFIVTLIDALYFI